MAGRAAAAAAAAEEEEEEEGRCRVPVQVQVRDRYGRFGGVFAGMGPVNGPVRALGLQPRLLLGRIVVFLRHLHAEVEKDGQDEADHDHETGIDQRVAPVEVTLDEMEDGEHDDGGNCIEDQPLGSLLEVICYFHGWKNDAVNLFFGFLIFPFLTDH